MSVDPDTFRAVLGRFASGVTVVTACDAHGRDYGMTVSAFRSASLEPPLVLICIDRKASMLPVLGATTHFAVSVLSDTQEALSRRFAGNENDRFTGIGFRRGSSGLVLLDDALAHIECRIVGRHEAGDHDVFLGEVETATAHAGQPLLYYRGGYTQLER